MAVRLEIIALPGGWADGDACAARLDTWTGGALIELFLAANSSGLPYCAIRSTQESIMEAPDCPAAMRDGIEYNARKTVTFRQSQMAHHSIGQSGSPANRAPSSTRS